ncbi:hypothetical protein THZB04_20106 [Vibrio owensii]|nr:hypothetical protein THZB04_20106 [Vibrio owensii]
MKRFIRLGVNCAYFEQIYVIALKQFGEMKAISKCERQSGYL